MRASKRVLSLLLIVFLLVLVACSNPLAGQPDATTVPIDELEMLVDRGDLSPKQISRKLELEPNRTYKDFIDLGTSYMWMGEYVQAAEAYEIAARRSSTTPELVGALYNKSAALAYAGQTSDALRTADLMAKLQPRNAEVAWLRYALYLHSEDTLGRMVAADHLASLEPDLAGEEVIGVAEATVITAAIVVFGVGTVNVAALALVPPEDRAEVVVPMMNGYHNVVAAMITGSDTLGRVLGKSE